MGTVNHYVVLGIPENADGDTIRSAFRSLARRFHPDAGAGSSIPEFRQALEAYETLSDPERRRRYDHSLQASRSGPPLDIRIPVHRSVAEPLIRPRAASRSFPGTRMPYLWETSFDELIEQLFAPFEDELRWRRRR
jgi:curved DNA-binding protein CbpA